MQITFYFAAFIALFATLMVVINTNPVHALLYLVLSLLGVATVFVTLGAPFAAALEVIVYAGAILVLFVFVVMMLNLGRATSNQESIWLSKSAWVPAAIMSGAIFGLIASQLWPQGQISPTASTVLSGAISAKAVGISLYGPYLLAVELASMMLLAGLVAAYHLGKNDE